MLGLADYSDQLSRQKIWLVVSAYLIIVLFVLDNLEAAMIGDWIPLALVLWFAALMTVEPLITKHLPQFVFLYPFLQSAPFVGAYLAGIPVESLSFLFALLCIYVIRTHNPSLGFAWVGVFIVVTTTMLIRMDTESSVKFAQIIAYALIFVFFATYALALEQTEAVCRQNETLFARLQRINKALEDYSLHIEEMTVFEERNRLAHELHDSVTQAVFGMTFLVRSAALLLDEGTEKVTKILCQLETMAQDALDEMRSLILKLRPSSDAEEALVSQRLDDAAMPEHKDDLSADSILMGQSFITRHGLQDKLLALISYFWILPIPVIGLHLFPDDGPLIIGISIWFGFVMVLEPIITGRVRWFAHLYPVIQMMSIILLYYYVPQGIGTWNEFFTPLGIYVIRTFHLRRGLMWIGFFSLVNGATIYSAGDWLGGLGEVISTVVILLLIASYVSAFKHARAAQLESQELLAELGQANRQLKTYAIRTETLTAIKERNRLARELHDSATQSIFTMTLITKSALILLERDPDQVPGLLDQLHKLAQAALDEMHALIYQLRPISVSEEGLLPALRRHVADVKKRDQVIIDLITQEEEYPLDQHQQQELFRIIQEALNNIVKHAQTDHATIQFDLMDACVEVTVADHGVGFDALSRRRTGSHIGLDSMRERAGELGGEVTVRSSPGQGATVNISIPRTTEG